MEPALFDQLQETLASQGPHIAIERLCKTLRADKDYANLFYALLLKKRHELGVSPVPTESAQALPEAVHAPYEDAIREAGRLVGQLYLDAGDIPRAWMYFRMIGESEPVARAREGQAPAGQSVRELMAGRDYLFEDDFYHVDVSHLSSIVQMSVHLPPCPELEQARELCAYGQRLSPRFQSQGDPPFDDQYRDYAVYLSVLAGDHP